jgi:hypothetical protein
MADRRAPDDGACDLGDEPRVLDEVPQVVAPSMPLEELYMLSERFPLSDEPKAEAVGGKFSLRRPILRFIVGPQRPQAQGHLDILVNAVRDC